MALQEQLHEFEKEQEKCRTILTSIAAFKKAQLANARSPALAVRFSNDTERLELINSIKKAPLGAQIEDVINLLLERRQVLTLEQINEACYVDLKPNKAVIDTWKNNPKINCKGISYESKHDVKDKNQLQLIRNFPDAIDLMHAYPNVMKICSNGRDTRAVLQAKAKGEPGNQQEDQAGIYSSYGAFWNW